MANAMMVFLANIPLPAVEGGADRAHSTWYTDLWGTHVSFLDDKLTALAQFTYIAVEMRSRCSSRSFNDNTRALTLRSWTLVLLQARVAEERITEYSTCYAMCLLLVAEVYSENFDAALVRASMLVSLLQTGKISGNFFVFWTF